MQKVEIVIESKAGDLQTSVNNMLAAIQEKGYFIDDMQYRFTDFAGSVMIIYNDKKGYK